MAEFAADYERNDQGWILFPRDVERRRELFPDEVFEHPAKANIFLTEELIYYLTEPGDHILDPFGGTGTTMIAALHGRLTTLIDIEERFCNLMAGAITKWASLNPAPIFVRQGDCRQVLPIPCDAIITSPPYSTGLGGGTGMRRLQGGSANTDEKLRAYSGTTASPLNIGRLNPFLFGKAMVKVYKGLTASLPAGGPLAIIMKDIMRGGNREMLSSTVIRDAQRSGFKLAEWYKWNTAYAGGGSAQRKLMKAKGATVVEDEDILLFRKD